MNRKRKVKKSSNPVNKPIKTVKKNKKEDLIESLKNTAFLVSEREGEQKEIINYALKYEETDLPGIIHIYGTPGSGKTHTIKNTIDFLKEKIKKDIFYLNVISTKNFIKNLEALRKNKKKFILFLDEIDLLKKKFYEVFDNIYEMKILCFVISNSFIISNFMHSHKSINKNEKLNKILSRIGDISIKFEPYSFRDFQNKCSNKYIARYLSTYGDMRKINEMNKIMDKKGELNAVESIKIVKNTFQQIINLVEISFHEKIMLEYIYAHETLDYADYHAFCKIREKESVKVEDFQFILGNLHEKGFLKKNKPIFLKEELKKLFTINF